LIEREEAQINELRPLVQIIK